MADKNNIDVQRPSKGLHTDSSPVDQPQGTYRYALNGVDESHTGDQGFITTEGSSKKVNSYPNGSYPIGDVYMSEGNSLVFLTNPSTQRDYIGILDKDDSFNVIVETSVLGFNIKHQIDATYRIRRANERFVYWVDGNGDAKNINLDNLYAHYSIAFKNYISGGGDPALYAGEKWSAISFELISAPGSIPRFVQAQTLPYGNTKSGSYNFAVAYEDADGNPSGWLTVSNTVNIFVDTDSSAYHTIRGSRNVTNEVQSFPNANKSIEVTLGNLDQNYPFYRVAVIQAYDGTGKPVKALVLPKKSTKSPVFIYSGNDAQLAETPLQDIYLDPEVIKSPQHIEQLENRLLLASTKGPEYDWCNFQQYASKIGADLDTEAVTLNSVQSPPNIKNPNSTFILRGYMPGDVYSFGIIYLMKGNIYSPVFHIPGKAQNNSTSRMGYYELPNLNYEDIHNCDGATNFWDRDFNGNMLRNTRVRHHKFPTRKEVGIDLISSTDSTTVITKYRLKYLITLKQGQTYPTDLNGDPIAIPFKIDYKNEGDPTVLSYNGTLTQAGLGTQVTFYDSLLEIDPVPYAPDYAEFDPASDFVTLYGSLFDYSTEYEEYTLDTIYNTTTSDIFGIEFFNIEKPHPDCIGFFIVRNERLDTDKIVVDNAIMGATMKLNDYTAFAHFLTDFPWPLYDERASWLFTPEHQFLGKFPQFQDMQVQGFYRQTFKHIPPPEEPMTDPETGNTVPNATVYQGVTVRDVMAGTSYNPDIDKKKYKDTDGFALVVGYRASDLAWSLDTDFPNPIAVDEALYLSAASNKLVDSMNFYNVSCDNKIGMAKFSNPIDTNLMFNANAGNTQITYGNGTQKNTSSTPNVKRLAYVTLVNDNRSAYEDFMVRTYYKEHHNAIMFGNANVVNGHRVFNGDVNISAMTLTTTMFNKLDFAERKKKKSWWKIVLGSVLVVAGAILSIFGGAGVPVVIGGLALLSAAAIGIGVSMIMSGIKLEQMKNMIETDYEKGLIAAVNDWEVAGQANGYPFGGNPENVNLGDDAILWFADRLNNVYIESSVPVGLRSGATGNITDFINSPNAYDDEEFRGYLTEKLTTIDTEQNDGRLYRGFPVSEFYDVNLDYHRFNFEKSYIHLPETYNCCSDKREDYPLRVWYSQQSFQEESTDNYKVFLPQNYRDIEGEFGVISDLYKVGNSLYIQTREALWQLPQNVQERTNTDLVTFIGTGDFFAIPPNKVTDNKLGSAGTQHKWANQKTARGVFSVNELEGKVYLHGQGVEDITLKGERNWFRKHLKSFLVDQVYRLTQVNLDIDNNPANKNGVGIHATYDGRHERYILTKRDYLIRSEWTDTFAISTGFAAPFNVLYYDINVEAFAIKKPGNLQQLFIRTIVDFDNPDYFENKSWTKSFSINTDSWKSEHSYIPNYYIRHQREFYATSYKDFGMWKHNQEGDYLSFFGVKYPHILEVVSVSNPLQVRMWNDLTLNTTAKRYNPTSEQYREDRNITFNKMLLYNESQSSGERDVRVKTSSSDYLFEQIQDVAGVVLTDNIEGNWNINDLRDYVVDYDVPLFTSEWDDIASQYPIDKIPNPDATDFNKSWEELQSFRSKYLIIRYKFDNFADVKLTTNYTLEGEEISGR